jgi:hypothetical protein
MINLPYILNEPLFAALPPFGKAKCQRSKCICTEYM